MVVDEVEKSIANYVREIAQYNETIGGPDHWSPTVTRFGHKMGQIGSKWDLSGNFSDQIQYILARRAKMYWTWSEKFPECVPFGANLTHFGSKSVHRVAEDKE